MQLLSTAEGSLVESVIADAGNTNPTVSPYTKTILEKNRVILSWAFVVIMVVMMAIVKSRWTIGNVVSESFLFCGIALALIGCIGRIWCSLFISGHKTTNLVVVGPYGVCRNPLYFFSAIGAFGVALGCGTFLIPVVVAVCFAAYYPLIMRAEERRLLEIHGEAFRLYCQEVPRFLPRLGSLYLPDSYEIRPRIVLNALIQATCFVWFTLITHAIYQLHLRTNLLPALFLSY